METREAEHKTAELEVEEISAEDIRRQFGDLLVRAGFGGERFIITRHGKQTAAIVSMKDYERLRAFDAASTAAA